MARKKKKPSESGGSWMDTYGDMVTLLLTFFIMLYAMSNLNQEKWEIFVKSINPASGETQQIAINEQLHDGQYDVTGNLQTEQALAADDIGKLYLALVSQLNNAGVADVAVSRGEGYTFVEFQGKTFFDGESSVLTEEGKRVLDVFCSAIQPVADQIAQIDVLGHTSQGDPGRPNHPRTDRMLSAMRSAEVTVYIQEKGIIAPEKMVGISYGQFRPVESPDTKEGRAANRRVELLLLDADAPQKPLDEYLEDYMSGGNEKIMTTGVPAETAAPTEAGPENTAGVNGGGISPAAAQGGREP